MVYFRNGYMPQNYQSEQVCLSYICHAFVPFLVLLASDDGGEENANIFNVENFKLDIKKLVNVRIFSLVGLASPSADGALSGCEMS